jgi:hypothetical protein
MTSSTASRSESAIIKVIVSDGIAVFDIRGSASRTSVIDALKPIFEISPQPHIRAALACYDRADATLQIWDLMAIYMACKEGCLPTHVPTAVVVKPDVYEPVRDYCTRQATHGVLRAAFTDRGQAMDWALDMAALIEAQRVVVNAPPAENHKAGHCDHTACRVA